MTALFFISLTLFVAYIVTIMIVYKIPTSMSESFYHPKIGYAFALWCYAIAISVMVTMCDLSTGQWFQFLSLFAAGGLMFVGTAPRFKTHERLIHYCAAGTSAVSATIWMCAAEYWYIPIPLVVLFAATAHLTGRSKVVFWMELALFASIYTVMGIQILGG
jgi:hypothetical protein